MNESRPARANLTPQARFLERRNHNRPERKNRWTGEAQGLHSRARSVDTKQLIDVVKAEVKGGESSEGPWPFSFMWQPSKKELISDEPLVVKAPLGLALTPEGRSRTGRKPTRLPRGKYELGPPLYFDPQGVARRYRELCDLS